MRFLVSSVVAVLAGMLAIKILVALGFEPGASFAVLLGIGLLALIVMIIRGFVQGIREGLGTSKNDSRKQPPSDG